MRYLRVEVQPYDNFGAALSEIVFNSQNMDVKNGIICILEDEKDILHMDALDYDNMQLHNENHSRTYYTLPYRMINIKSAEIL